MSQSAEERERILEELAAAIEARRELGPKMEAHVVESFLERVEQSSDRRVDERLAKSAPPPRPSRSVAFWTLVFGVGATAIVATHFGHATGLVALMVVWVALAAINWAYARAR